MLLGLLFRAGGSTVWLLAFLGLDTRYIWHGVFSIVTENWIFFFFYSSPLTVRLSPHPPGGRLVR